MNVLMLINSFRGLVSFRMEVVDAIISAGHKVIIAGPTDDNSHILEDMGCGIYDIQFDRKGTSPLKDISLTIRYIKLLRQLKPDVVLSYTIKPNVYGGMACRLCNIPQFANVTGLGTAVEKVGWLQYITVVLCKLSLRKAHTVFFQNKANLEFCKKKKIILNNAKLIPGSGVNLQYHKFQDYPSSDVPCCFVFISRLIREKGIEEYLEAAKEIKKKYPETEFHILGTMEDNYAVKVEQLQKDGVVIYHGRQPDVRPYIGMAHCTVHPSYYPEGMSNVLLESCSAGRPIITTDRPGCGEIVDDGINGFVIKQKDSSDLAVKIEMFLELPLEKKRAMGLAARKKVEKEFDRNIVVKAYMDEMYTFAHGV